MEDDEEEEPVVLCRAEVDAERVTLGVGVPVDDDDFERSRPMEDTRR
jgi:hypothetical protein